MIKHLFVIIFVAVSICIPALANAQQITGSHTSAISEIMLYDGTYPGTHIKFVDRFSCAHPGLPITNDYARFSLLTGDEISSFESGVAMLLSAKTTGATVTINYNLYGGFVWAFPWINCSVTSIEIN